jgi:hypothetical protein
MNKIVSNNSNKTYKFVDLEVGSVFLLADSVGDEAYMKITSMTRINKITGAQTEVRAVQLSSGNVFNFSNEEIVILVCFQFQQ